MKKTFKVLVLGIFTAMMLTVGSVSIFAQDDVCDDFEANQALYAKYTTNYKGSDDQKKMAIAAAKEYVQKYAACEQFKPQVDYLKKAGPGLQEKLDVAAKEKEVTDRYNRFDKAMKAEKAGEIFASGADILKHEPDYLDIIIILASVGLDEAAENKVDTYNNETLSYANSAISKLNSNVESKSKKFGEYGYLYNTKENALGWMNYAIGFVKYYRQDKKEEGLSYFYKSTQFNSETKDKGFIYALIAETYREKSADLSQEIIAIIKGNGGKENFESKSKDALLRGYLDRALDAYAKAYDLTKEAAPKTAIYDTMKTLYKFRYETVGVTINDADLNTRLQSYVSSAKVKTLPNPTSEVQPVNPPVKEEETPADSTDTSGDSSTSMTKPEKKMETKANDKKPSTSMNKTDKKPADKMDATKPKN